MGMAIAFSKILGVFKYYQTKKYVFECSKECIYEERNCFYEGVPLYMLKELDRKSYLERERHA